MPSFSRASLINLNTCHPKLQELANEVVKTIDCTVVCGFRNQQEQEKAFLNRRSDKHWPDSKHNSNPSTAMDLVPYVSGSPTWQERQAYFFSGRVVEIANRMGIPIRTGADWDQDNDVNDQGLKDPCHFELITQVTP